MAKPAKPEVSNFASLSDAGYKSARTMDSLRDSALWLMDNMAGFPDNIDAESRTQFYTGSRQRFAEINPAVAYGVVDGNFIPMAQLPKDAAVAEKRNIGVEYAFSMTQQEFGALKNNEPKLHAIVGALRDKANKYCSNVLKSTCRKGMEIQRERNGESKTRQQAKNYAEFIESTLESMTKRCISAVSRGDVTADKKKLDAAIIAFRVKMEAK